MSHIDETAWCCTAWLRDPNLSLKERGMLLYLANQPAGEPMTIMRIARDNADGRTSIEGVLASLTSKGYVRLSDQRRVGYELTAEAAS